MTDIVQPAPGIELIRNKDALEPEEYFTILKAQTQIISAEDIEAQLKYLASEIIRCRDLGQKVLAEKMDFHASVLVREKMALKAGFRDYIMRHALEEKIDKITPKNGVKLIELDRYPRVIPHRPASDILAAKKSRIFDDFMVLFTDLTQNKYQTPAERKFIERNTDPICLGYFKDKKASDVYNRLYLVADWVDEKCDLTWDRMVNSLKPEDVGHITSSLDVFEPGKPGKGASWWRKWIAKMT